MRDSGGARAILRLLLLAAPWVLLTATVEGQAEASTTEASREAESTSRFSFAVKGFGGALFSEEARRGGGGGGLVGAFAIVPERWEIELGLSLVAARDEEPLGVFEVIGKRLFEGHGAWAPHLLLGPAFSLDFGREAKPSGGVLLGTGVTYWFNARVGAVSDAAYRVLISAGPEVEHVLSLALGLTVRI